LIVEFAENSNITAWVNCMRHELKPRSLFGYYILNESVARRHAAIADYINAMGCRNNHPIGHEDALATSRGDSYCCIFDLPLDVAQGFRSHFIHSLTARVCTCRLLAVPAVD
jgi:hypothetical protein